MPCCLCAYLFIFVIPAAPLLWILSVLWIFWSSNSRCCILYCSFAHSAGHRHFFISLHLYVHVTNKLLKSWIIDNDDLRCPVYSLCLNMLTWWNMKPKPFIFLSFFLAAACPDRTAPPSGPSRDAGSSRWCPGWSRRRRSRWRRTRWLMPRPIKTHRSCCRLKRATKKVRICIYVCMSFSLCTSRAVSQSQSRQIHFNISKWEGNSLFICIMFYHVDFPISPRSRRVLLLHQHHLHPHQRHGNGGRGHGGEVASSAQPRLQRGGAAQREYGLREKWVNEQTPWPHVPMSIPHSVPPPPTRRLAFKHLMWNQDGRQGNRAH